MKAKTLNGTTLTPFSCKDFSLKEWSDAEIIAKEIENCEIRRGTEQFKEFIYSRLNFYKVSFDCLMTVRNSIDKKKGITKP